MAAVSEGARVPLSVMDGNSRAWVKKESGEKEEEKSAAQIMMEQSARSALPGIRRGSSRRVYPLVSLNPYEGNWTIKVRVTGKGPMRTFSNARGNGSVFNVELTDREGTQIQATMFKEAADKFHDKLQMGKMYYISKGSLRPANKRFSSINNDYEMTLNQNSEVEEIQDQEDGPATIPMVKYNFLKFEDLGPFVNGRRLIDVVGIVQSVSPNTTVRRKSNNEEIPKRDITIADQSGKTVVLTLWNDLATDHASKLEGMADDAPVIAARAVRVSDYQGVSLSTSMSSTVLINPSDVPEVQALRTWYDEEGRTTDFTPAGASLPTGLARQAAASDRATLAEVTEPEVGATKPAYFTLRAYVSYIKPDQAMWYLACTKCNKKVTEDSSTNFWCAGCDKAYETCNRRYIMMAKISDFSGEGWICAFNEQAEQILGQSAHDLAEIKTQDTGKYNGVLKGAAWAPKMLGIGVASHEYMGEKRQRITVRSVGPVNWAAECKLMVDKISAMS